MNTEKNIKTLLVKKPLKLDCGKTINNFPIAYETYGSLNEKKDNAILVFHALTGDQFVTGLNPITKKDGWWSYAVGPNKSIDTNKYFVICANVIGGCMGSYGPNSLDSKTNNPIGINFPVITINLELNGLSFFISISLGLTPKLRRSFTKFVFSSFERNSLMNLALNFL